MKTVAFVEELANKIIDLRLTAPAILLLEAHKPLAFVGSQLLLIAQPTLGILLPKNLVENTANLLANPDQLETLITRLETNSAAPPANNRGRRL